MACTVDDSESQAFPLLNSSSQLGVDEVRSPVLGDGSIERLDPSESAFGGH